MAGGHGDRNSAETDPLNELQLGITLVIAEEQDRKNKYDQLLRERDALRAEIRLLQQEITMRTENTARTNGRIEHAKKVIESLTAVRAEQVRAKQALQSELFRQQVETAEAEKDLKSFNLFATTGKPAQLLAQMREKKSELAALIAEKERKLQIRRQEKSQRRKEKEQQLRQRAADNWSTKVTLSGNTSVGRVDDADDELNVVMAEKDMGMDWLMNDMVQPSLD
jgi:chromosome segregation ATPase